MRTAGGLLLALAAAGMLNAGFYMQHGASKELPRLSLRHPLRALRLLFGEIRWLAGWVAGWVGWGLYILAVRLAPLSLVQAVAAGGVGVIAFMSWRWGKVPLTRSERVGAWTCLGGIALILCSLAGRIPSPHSTGWHSVALWVLGSVVVAGVVALLSAGPLARHVARGAGLGAAAGLLYAAGDIATKGAVAGVGLLFVPVLLGCHLLGFVAMQMAFQRGRALATAGLVTLLNNTIPIAAGVFVFRERIPMNGFGVLRVVGFLGAVVGAVCLARRSADAQVAPGTQASTGGAPPSMAPRPQPSA